LLALSVLTVVPTVTVTDAVAPYPKGRGGAEAVQLALPVVASVAQADGLTVFVRGFLPWAVKTKLTRVFVVVPKPLPETVTTVPLLPLVG
jgi:hypothetical protein